MGRRSRRGITGRGAAAVAAFGALAFASGAVAEPDIQAGEELHQEACIACHGAEGISGSGEWPSLAGQHADYTRYHLRLFRDEDRWDPGGLMTPNAVDLSDEDIENVAAYYAQLEPPVEEADEELVDRGERIYRQGLPDDGVAACMACHGPAGAGIPEAGYPRVGGQKAEYLKNSLQAYKDEDRESDRNRMMRDIAGRMSEEDMRAVASYMAGLYAD